MRVDLVVLVTVVTALSGCAELPVSKDSVRVAGDGAVNWGVAKLGGATPTRLIFASSWQREEYVSYQGLAAHGELILAAANPYRNVVLDYQLGLRQGIESWQANEDGALEWGEGGRYQYGRVTFFHQAYRLPKTGLSCFGFSGQWAAKVDDFKHRPGTVLFGYYCEPGKEFPEQVRMKQWISSVSVARVDWAGGQWTVNGQPDGASGDGARRPLTADWRQLSGNPGFPFRFGRNYQIGGGGNYP